MSGGEIAGLIAAVAFVVLVCFLCSTLLKISQTLKSTNESIIELTKKADTLSDSLSKVIDNTNDLLSDVNDKATELDPLVKALGDVGQSVSDVNSAARNAVEKINSRDKAATKIGTKLVQTAGKAVATNALSHLFGFGKRKKAEKGE